MKKRLFILLFLNLKFIGHGQNLIPNPSFESVADCFPNPDTLSITSWFRPSDGTSDNFATCFNPNYSDLGVPNNFAGYQLPHSGQAYAGAELFIDGNNFREYLETKLISPLQSGRRYCISLYVSLANVSGCAISDIQLYFSNDSLIDTTFSAPIISVIPQISDSIIISDTAIWTLISAEYVAFGGELFLTIGNFSSSANTNFVSVFGGSTPMAYYYIDDVSIVECDTTAALMENSNANVFNLFPNPSNGSISLYYNLKDNDEGKIRIYNSIGKMVAEYSLTKTNSLLLLDMELSAGIYPCQIIIDEKSVFRDKIIITK